MMFGANAQNNKAMKAGASAAIIQAIGHARSGFVLDWSIPTTG
jgi:hypothetical protein